MLKLGRNNYYSANCECCNLAVTFWKKNSVKCNHFERQCEYVLKICPVLTSTTVEQTLIFLKCFNFLYSMAHSTIIALWVLRQKNGCKFEASLVYLASSRLAMKRTHSQHPEQKNNRLKICLWRGFMFIWHSVDSPAISLCVAEAENLIVAEFTRLDDATLPIWFL